MTAKRDLKRRVRERQARTGESYMTALQHVKAERPRAIPVVELVDLTGLGAALGLTCRIAMYPALVERVDPARTLERLRAALRATEHDPGLALMAAVVLRGARPRLRLGAYLLDDLRRFVARARAGVAGVSQGGQMLALQVPGRGGPETVLFLLWLAPTSFAGRAPLLILAGPDGAEPILGWPARP